MIADDVADAVAMSYTSMLELVVVVVDIVLATVSASATKEPCNRLSLLTEAAAATSSCCSLREVTLLDDASRDKAETMVLVMLSAALHADQSLSPR